MGLDPETRNFFGPFSFNSFYSNSLFLILQQQKFRGSIGDLRSKVSSEVVKIKTEKGLDPETRDRQRRRDQQKAEQLRRQREREIAEAEERESRRRQRSERRTDRDDQEERRRRREQERRHNDSRGIRSDHDSRGNRSDHDSRGTRSDRHETSTYQNRREHEKQDARGVISNRGGNRERDLPFPRDRDHRREQPQSSGRREQESASKRRGMKIKKVNPYWTCI